MSPSQATDRILARIDDMRGSWGRFLLFGILLILLGVFCLIADVTVTFATVLFFGCLLLISGIIALIHAFRVQTWSGFFLYLLSALLRGFTGYLLIRFPGVGAIGLTMILASFFVVGGLFRAIGAETLHFPRWGWFVSSGIVSVALGIALLVHPVSGFWFIGFAIGIDLILEGASIVGLAVTIHNVLNVAHPKAA